MDDSDTVPIHPGPQIQPQAQWDATAYKDYPRKCVLGMSVTVIVLGIMCVIIGVAQIFVQIDGWPIGSTIGSGIWGGAFFILVGSFGVVSARSTTTCWLVTVLTMSIIGAVVSVGPLTTGSLGWVIGSDYHYNYSDKTVAVNALLVFAAVAAGSVLIIMSALACYGLCSKTSSNRPMLVAGQMQFMPGPDGQQQMVIIPINQDTSYTPGQQEVVANPHALAQQTFLPAAPPSAVSPVAPPAYEEKQQLPEQNN